ncbi:MAG TPA: hypothetical protein VNQ32_06915 [Steroidobacteraceae bacterium]|nr:hypothetical protein [Steroidobacteraceae bacterium]
MRAGAILAAVLARSVPVQAEGLSIHGFGTLGIAHVDQPADWAYTRSLNQKHNGSRLRADLDSVVGLQLNYRPLTALEFVGQASYARLGGEARRSDFLQLAYLAWRPGADWSVRAGRLNLDAYLISEYRDVGYTYPFIRPPVEFYSRMPDSLDGLDVTRTWVSGDAQWRAKAFAGHTTAGIGERRLKLEPMHGVMLEREDNGLLLRVSALRARTHTNRLAPLLDALHDMQALPVPQVADEAAGLATALATSGAFTSYLAAAVAYDRNDWLLQVEVNRAWARKSSAINFNSGYVSFGRRFGAITAYLMESAALRDYGAFVTPDWATPLAGIDPLLAQQSQALASAATTAANKLAGSQFTTSAGLRWDVAPRLALKTQLDVVHTRRDGDGLWHRADGRKANSTILGVAADFVF